MPYFKHKQPTQVDMEPLFRQAVPLDEPDDDEDDLQDWQDDPQPAALTEDEATLSRRDHARLVFGIGDFFGVLAGTVLILLLVAVLISLLNWLLADVDQFLELWK